MAQRVIIYDSRVDDLFNEGGLVGRGLSAFGRDAKAAAIAGAPVNKNGTSQGLAQKHRVRTRNRGGRYFTVELSNEADYAKFVHEGTTGPIRASKIGKLMTVGASAGRIFALSAEVRGQKANPWMSRAAQRVARARGWIL